MCWFIQLFWPFVISLKSNLTKWIDKYLCCVKFEWDVYLDEASELESSKAVINTNWVFLRCEKNAILIFQTAMSSFPQLILQLTAMFYYQDTNDAFLSASITCSILSLSNIKLSLSKLSLSELSVVKMYLSKMSLI